MRMILNYQLSFFRAVLILISSSVTIAILCIPFAATVDGIVYISNAKSLFTPDFQEEYTFYREPIYPLLLKLIHVAGDSVVLVILFQAVLLSLGTGLALIALKLITRSNTISFFELVIICLGTWSPYYLSFSGAVLQQALFVFELAVYGLILGFSFQNLITRKRILLLGITLVWLFITTWSSVGWIYLGAVPTALIVVVNFAKTFKINYYKIVGKSLVFILFTIGLLMALFLGRLSFSGWETIKSENSQLTTKPTEVIKPVDGIPTIDMDFKSNMERLSALIGIGERDIYVSEQRLIVQKIQFSGSWPRFYYDSVWQKKNLGDYPAGYFSVANPGYKFSEWYGANLQISNWSYSLVFLLSGAAIIWSLFKRNWSIIAYSFIPISFILVYLASNTPIDRYGLPAYPFALALISVSASTLCRWGLHHYKIRTSVNKSFDISL